MDVVLWEEKNNVGWLTLNCPETRNALSLEMIGTIQAQLNQLRNREDIRALVVRGNGPVFCAGHNLRELTDVMSEVGRLRQIFMACSEMMLTLQALPQPVIAQVHGIATAAGCQLGAACDLAEAAAYRYATESMVVNSMDMDAGEGISAFLEKRSPVWKKRDR